MYAWIPKPSGDYADELGIIIRIVYRTTFWKHYYNQKPLKTFNSRKFQPVLLNSLALQH